MDYPKHLIVLFIMTISIISGTITQAQKTKVTIHNDIGGGLSLWYNCKSGNNNLGDRRLAPGGSWPFDFKPDVFGRTLFFCRFSWGNEWHHFDIYKQERDREFEKFGCRKCEWKIRKNGPCKLNKSNGMFDAIHVICQLGKSSKEKAPRVQFLVGNEELPHLYAKRLDGPKRLGDTGYLRYKFGRTNNLSLLTALPKDYFRVVNSKEIGAEVTDNMSTIFSGQRALCCLTLGMVHIDLEQTHGYILLPRSHQQCFHISLSRMRYGEGMVVVKEVMEAMIWFHGPTNFSLSHLCTASSLLFASFLGPPRQIRPGNSPHVRVPRVHPQTLGF
uniref:S-protein homolog n=1 Tax=Brassica oleracea TaxID=3712 RepID=A0A3P6F2H5_BRAOL|nr:unnamed protein product [Brassica oleracea]